MIYRLPKDVQQGETIVGSQAYKYGLDKAIITNVFLKINLLSRAIIYNSLKQ